MRCEDINQWLDLLMDDELDAGRRRELDGHARSCPACAEQLRTTLQLKAALDALPEEADVPLAAQAAWRSAVRAESKRRGSRRVTRALTGVAAAAVVALGIGWALGPGAAPKGDVMVPMAASRSAAYEEAADYDVMMAESVMLASDGMLEAEESALAAGGAAPESAPMQQVSLRVQDAQAAAEGIMDTAAELEGEASLKTIEGVGAHIEVTLPAENAADFLLAVSQWDEDPSGVTLPELPGEGVVSLLLVLGQ